MTATTPASTSTTPVNVDLPVDDLELTVTVGLDVTTYLEGRWHAGACGCLLIDDACVTFGDRWNEYAPLTWSPKAVLVALREVATAQQPLTVGTSAPARAA